MAATTENSTANSLPPAVTLSHGALLSSTPWRGCEFFPHLVGEESGKHTYDMREPQVHHMWTTGIVKKIIFLISIIFQCDIFYSSFLEPLWKLTSLSTL